MSQVNEQDTLDLKEIIGGVTSRWYYFVIGLAIMVPLGFLLLKSSPDIFKVQATLLLDDKSNDAMTSRKFMKELGLLVPKSELEDEVGILSSYDLIREVVQRADLTIEYYKTGRFRDQPYHRDDFPFIVEVDSSKLQLLNVPIYVTLIDDSSFRIRVSAKDAKRFDTRSGKAKEILDAVEINEVYPIAGQVEAGLPFVINFKEGRMKKGDNSTYFILKGLNALAERYQRKLKVTPLTDDGNMVELISTGQVVASETEFINTLMEVFIERERTKVRNLGLKTLNFIDAQITHAEDSLRDAEQRLLGLRSRGDSYVDVNASAQRLSGRLTELERDRNDLTSRLNYYTYIKKTLDENNELADVVAPSAMGINDPLLSRLLVKLSDQQQERAALSYSVKEGHPELVKLDRQILNTRAALKENVSNMVSSTEIALRDVEGESRNTRGKLIQLPSIQTKLTGLGRLEKVSADIYRYLLEKRQQVMIALASSSVDKVVIDYARMRGKVGPKPPLYLGAAGFLGLVLPILFMIISDFFDDRIKGEGDLTKSSQIPVVGYILQGSKDSVLIGATNANRALAESFRAVRVTLQYLIAGKKKMVIGLTSSQSGEGKTFCAANLSVVMAQSGKRTVLIDADLRKPKYDKYYENESNKIGLSSYLAGLNQEEEIVRSTHIPNLDIVPSGPVASDAVDLISKPRLESLINTMRDRYDYVIIDTPPLGLVSDYLIIKEYTDYNIYVVRHGYTDTKALDRINELYNTERITNLGLIINGVKSISSYGYNKGNYGYYLADGK
ncbi:MAG: polysaccharide biosynthesis tyrosine autokinase [Bacteroidota bacterium]